MIFVDDNGEFVLYWCAVCVKERLYAVCVAHFEILIKLNLCIGKLTLYALCKVVSFIITTHNFYKLPLISLCYSIET